MPRRAFLRNTLFTTAGIVLMPPFSKAHPYQPSPQGLLDADFLNPPAAARPWCCWVWMNGNIAKEGITLDLEAMQRMGIGGAIISHALEGIPAGSVALASDIWMDMLAHTTREAQRLGIEIMLQDDVATTGGKWITPEMSLQQLVWSETTVTGGQETTIQLPQPNITSGYYQDAYVIAYPQSSTISSRAVVDISRKMNADGKLQWNAPAGSWVVVRIGHTAASETKAVNGLLIDVFRKEALEHHFDQFLNKLLGKVKANVGKSFTGLAMDTVSIKPQHWSKNIPKTFKDKTGYDLLGWLPVLVGKTVDDAERTKRFLWDFQQVQSKLVTDNFYDYYANECHKKELQFSVQASPFQTFTTMEEADGVITGIDSQSNDENKLLYRQAQAVAFAHSFGKKVVASKAFAANRENARWTDYPYALKAQGDYYLSQGINRLTFQSFVHQPHRTAKPGMATGTQGMHMDRNNTWAEQAIGWTSYLQRAQFLLQQGTSVVDICYFEGDQPQEIKNFDNWLPDGFKADYISAAALQKASVKDKKLVLPGGATYQLCVLAPVQAIEKETLQQLIKLVQDGLTLVVSSKPVHAPGLTEDSEIQLLINELYGSSQALDGKTRTEVSNKKGKVIWGKTVEAVLNGMSVTPDFTYTSQNTDAAIHFTHRQTDNEHFYFLCNQQRKEENITVSFRMQGYQPEIWDSETGLQTDAVFFEERNGRTYVPFTMSASGAVFIVFRKKGQVPYTRLLQSGKAIWHAGVMYKKFDPTDYYFYKNTFRIMLWAKPDTYAGSGESMLIHAPEGDVMYGGRTAAVGLSAGQNGVRVYERARGDAKEVLFAEQKLEGWTHIALAYKDGKPAVYMNGKLVAEGKKSAYTVRPVLNIPPADAQSNSFFKGSFTRPQLIDNILPANEVEYRFKAGLPALLLPYNANMGSRNGRTTLLAWKDATYKLEGKNGSKEINILGTKQIQLSGGWKVQFPKGSGAPANINLPQLISLHLHPDTGVKYFAGTATYFKTVPVSSAYVAANKRIFLHLGRVEVLAEIKVNGRKAGQVWKEPYMLEITSLVKEGSNDLEIAVTTLWPNRLIGDEALPAENNYQQNGIIAKLPDWYVQNQPKRGKRITFSTWKAYDQNDPLVASGLLGPVNLLVAVETDVTPS